MRPGPSTEILARGIAAGFRVDVFRGGREIAHGIPPKNVQLSVAERTVPENLTYDAPFEWKPEGPLDALNSFGQQTSLTWLGDYRGEPLEVELGMFTHGSKENPGWRVNGDRVEVTSYGVLQLLEDNESAWPFSPRTGETLSMTLKRITGLPLLLDGVDDSLVPRTIQFGTSRTQNLMDVCAARNLGFCVKPDGYLHIWDLADHTPVVRYTTDDLLLDWEPVGQPRRPNRFIGVGTGDGEKKFTAQAGFTDAPFDEGYGVITERIEVSSDVSQQAVQNVVDARMRQRFMTEQTVSVEMIPDPRLELGDVAQFVFGGEHFTGRVVAYELSEGPSMRTDVEVLQW